MTASLAARLRRRVLLPLALTAFLGGAVTLTISYVSTNQAFDRALLDDASAVALHVVERGDDLALDLTEREIATVMFDRRERLLFSVRLMDGRLLAGDARLAGDEAIAPGRWGFGRQDVDGETVRTVTLHRERPAPFVVVVGQTTRERNEWLARLLLYALVPEAILLVLLGWWLGRSIAEEVAPLHGLQQAVQRRDAADLSPVDERAPSSEVSALAQAVNALLRRVGDGVAAQREFASNVAHELRTPLAGIRALAQHGLAQPDPAVWRAQLAAVLASGERASRLVDQLLALALGDEARDSLRMGPVAVDEVVRDTVLRYLPTADARGVDLGAEGLDQPLTAWGHATLVEGALANLLENALRYGRPAEGTPTLTVSLAREAGTVRLSVIDNGPGLSAHERARLLQRWAQGAPPGQRGSTQGAGLGLAIVSRYAAVMDARFELDDAPGGGLAAALVLRAAG